MREGLKIFTIPSGYYPFVLVAWLRRIGGDEWEACPGSRVISRFGNHVQLQKLAAAGPQAGTILLDPNPNAEEVNRLTIGRVLIADPEAWANECPRPKDWRE